MAHIVRLLFTLTLSLVFALPGCQSNADANVSAKTRRQYVEHCGRCHNVGAANAPRKGETHSWEKRMKKGKDALLRSVKDGLVAMPPKGGCDECTDEDLEALIEYLAR